MKTEYLISVQFASAEAAYHTWQDEMNIPPEPLQRQEPQVRQRWLKIAAAARAVPLMWKDGNLPSAQHHPAPLFQEPAPDTPVAEQARAM